MKKKIFLWGLGEQMANRSHFKNLLLGTFSVHCLTAKYKKNVRDNEQKQEINLVLDSVHYKMYTDLQNL